MTIWRCFINKIKRKSLLLFLMLLPSSLLLLLNSPLKNQILKNIEKSPHANESLKAAAVVEVKEDSGSKLTSKRVAPSLNYNVHAFYYAWYGSPRVDGQWWHWNHEYIPPWDKNDHNVYPKGAHQPPDDVGANFYPRLGPYSSRDPAVVSAHMGMLARVGVGLVAVSWYPPGLADDNGPPTDSFIPTLLQAASQHGLKICLHIEPYEGRNASNFRDYMEYVHKQYGSHPAYYKVRRGSRQLPLFYVYDSYRVTVDEWKKVLSSSGYLTVRKTELDAVFIGLVVEMKHRFDIKAAGFDGFYTYFAANGFSYGSTWKNWKSLASYAYKNSLLFIPSVGPGYVDTRVRPWNSKNTHARRKGLYYETAWRTAMAAPAKMISITSFNEWHEGTQIEPAVPKQCGNYTYQDYQPFPPDHYLQLTHKWVRLFSNQTKI